MSVLLMGHLRSRRFRSLSSLYFLWAILEARDLSLYHPYLHGLYHVYTSYGAILKARDLGLYHPYTSYGAILEARDLGLYHPYTSYGTILKARDLGLYFPYI